MTTAAHKAAKTMVAGGAPARRRWFGALAATAAVGFAVMASATAARADLVKDLLGVNPFASESSRDGLRPGVIVDESGEEIFCPRVDVFDNGATVRRGEGAGLSYQMTIGNLARECQRTQDGRIEVNVGVDIRALLGPSGRPGRFSSPVTIQVRRGDAIISRVTRQISVAIPAGEANAMATIVERGIQLPENTNDLLIEVGFGGAAPKARKRGR